MVNSTSLSNPPSVLSLMGHAIRWQILQALSMSDLCVQELVHALNLPQNLVSYHLHKLRANGLLRERRSLADRRVLYYSLDLNQVNTLYFDAGESLHPALGKKTTNPFQPLITKTEIRVLFLCTHNSARSQMAEGIFRTRNQMNIEVYSAGSEPTVINPLAIQVMREMGIDISKQRSKSLQEFLGQRYDYVITVCDRMRESCPIFPDDPLQIHWSFPDPAEVQGSENERLNAFREIAIQLNTRIAYLLLVIERRASESKNPRDDNQL